MIAAAVVLLGFLVRLWTASGTFFNPDEAMHMQAAWQPTLGEAYRASLGLAHPPLLILILNLCRHLGTSELMLRLPSVIAGTVFCWVLFLWLWNTLGQAVAWIGLVLACFLPPTIELSTEVRQYALLLCFLMLAVYWLELSFKKSSAVLDGSFGDRLVSGDAEPFFRNSFCRGAGRIRIAAADFPALSGWA